MADPRSDYDPSELKRSIRPGGRQRPDVPSPCPSPQAGYLNYRVREERTPGNNGYLWINFNLHIQDTFTAEQQQLFYQSSRLFVYLYGQVDTRAVQRIARNDPRSSSALPFQGRPQEPGGTVLTKDGMIAYAASDTEAGVISECIYTEILATDTDHNEECNVTIDRYEKDPDGPAWELGYATLNYYTNNAHTFKINLNSKACGSDSAYPFKLDRLSWASTILHEMLHCLGYDHAGDYETAYMNAYLNVAFPGGIRLTDVQ